MLALSVYPPWAAQLVAGVKRMEVRDWPLTAKLPQVVAIYATAGMDEATVKMFAKDRVLQQRLKQAGYARLDQIPRRSILGCVVFAASGTYEDYVSGKLRGKVNVGTVQEYLSPVGTEYGWYADFSMRFTNPLRVHGAPGLWRWQEPPAVSRLVAEFVKKWRER